MGKSCSQKLGPVGASSLNKAFVPYPEFAARPGKIPACADPLQVGRFIQGNYQDLPDLSDLQWARTRRAVRRVLDKSMEDSRDPLPGLEKAAHREVRTAAVYGLSESPGISGWHRPPMTLPGVRNLFLASDTVWDARGGVGMQAAASVALNLVERLFPFGERRWG